MSRKRNRRAPPKRNSSVFAALRRGNRKGTRPVLSLILFGLFMVGWLIIRHEPVIVPEDADVVVYVSPRCSCYRPWIRSLRRDGLAVSVVRTPDVAKSQARLGVPREFAACHTAAANDYWIEGHVPAASIVSLLNEAPANVAGLSHLRTEIESGHQFVWEVVSYDNEGDAISAVIQVEQRAEIDSGATHGQ